MAKTNRQKRKQEWALLFAGAFLIGILALSLHLYLNVLGAPIQGQPALMLWEIMPDDPGYQIDEDGDPAGWVEIHNTTSTAMSLSGYALTDKLEEPQQWQFPKIELGPQEHLVVFLSGKDRSDPDQDFLHTSFQMPPQDGTLYLVGTGGVIRDQLAYDDLPAGISFGRDEDQTDTWLYFPQATPGKANTTPGHRSLDFEPADSDSPLHISELMASNRRTIADEDGDFRDWIEVFNPTNEPIDLKGYKLSDDVEQPAKWIFPSLEIQPQERLVVFASGKDRRDPQGSYLHTNFRLNRRDDVLLFSTPQGHVINQILIRDLPPDVSLGQDPDAPGQWAYYTHSKPGKALTETGLPNLDFSETWPDSPVYINELMASNQYTLTDEDGDYPDWIEFHHTGEKALDLSGYFLSDDTSDPLLWMFPETIIEPGEHFVVFASGKDRRDADDMNLHTNFRLSKDQDVLYFRAPDGRIIDRIEIEDHLSDVSYGRDPQDPDRWLFFTSPNPRRANESHGHESLSADPPQAGVLFLNEIMAMNLDTLADDQGDYPNWIELYNAGNEAIDLTGFGLSDRRDEPRRWTFPEISIAAGEHLIVYASGEDRYDLNRRVLHTNFGISTLGEPVLLSDSIGRTIDKTHTGRLPQGISLGRKTTADGSLGDWVYYTDPSPGRANQGTYYEGITRPPQVLTRGGFYDDQVHVKLENPHDRGEIRYTLDGSIPTTDSRLYTGAIEINSTAVLRAKVFIEDKLAGQDQVETYFIDEDHGLPVISIAIDPFDFEDPVHGLHSMGPNASTDFPYFGANFHQDWERPAHFEYYETDGKLAYDLNVGFKVFGAFSRGMEQKSFALYARNRYEYDQMTYPFLENKDLLHFKHLVLRTSGQDANYSKIRGIMMTSLIAEETDLDYQGYSQNVLYINGRYWGIYNIREKINRYFLQNNHGLKDLDGADLLEGNARTPSFFKSGDNQHYDETLNYITRHDMNDPEHYAYIQSVVDVENFADFWICQMIIGNPDTGNIRYWRERSDEGKWRWIIYDLDWGFYFLDHDSVRLMTHPQGHGHAQIFSTRMIRGLLESDEFRDLFLERFAHHLNVTFETNRVIDRIDELAANIAPEIPRSSQRWSQHTSVADWQEEVEDLRDFARRRPLIIARQVQDYFNLSNEEMQVFDVWRNR